MPDPEPKKKLYSGLYDILEQQCNAEAIRSLLREAKDGELNGDDPIRLSGLKSDLVQRVQHLAGSRIKLADIYKVIRESEENGQQHIFLYKVAGGWAADPKQVMKALFGNADLKKKFPIFTRHIDKLDWADFRTWKVTTASNEEFPAWLGKLYQHESITRPVGKPRRVTRDGGYSETRDYEAEDANTVHVVRFRPPDLLEIRIDSTGVSNQDVVPTRLAAVLEKLEPIIPSDGLPSWSLAKAMTKILKKAASNSELYDVATCGVFDSRSGTIDFKPLRAEEIKKEQSRQKALDVLLNGGATGRRLVVTWKSVPTEEKKKFVSIRSTVCGEELNEVLIGSRVRARYLDYVINKFRAFSK